MSFVISRIFLFFLFFACGPVFGRADQDAAFKTQLDRVSPKIIRAASSRPFRFAGMNESLLLTARGIAAYRLAQGLEVPARRDPSTGHFYLRDGPIHPVLEAKEKHLKESGKLFRQALSKYSGNSLAGLWLAVVEEERGRRKKSNEGLTDFLRKKDAYGIFEKTILITPQEFTAIHSFAVRLVESRGISEEEIRRGAKGAGWPWNFRILEPADRLASIFFTGALLLGTLGLLLTFFTGNLYPFGWPRLLTGIYFSCWSGFVLWTADLKIGLPFQLSRFWVVPAFLIFMAVILLFREVVEYWKRRNFPVEKGYRRCPGCGQVFSELMLECPSCRRQKE
jgi:hypothetical protein